MFGKIKCINCNNKIKKDFDFCPYCGNQTQENKEDWGMLGKHDAIENQEQQNPFGMLGGFGGGMLGKMLNSTMKMLEKELQKEMSDPNQRRQNQNINSNFKLMINGQEIPMNRQQPQGQPNQQRKRKDKIKKIPLPTFTEKQRETFQKYKEKKEPLTNVRRLSDSIVYEMKMPGVSSESNLSIFQPENSIEIKALAKTKAYEKILPIALPIIGYQLLKGKLILELAGK